MQRFAVLHTGHSSRPNYKRFQSSDSRIQPHLFNRSASVCDRGDKCASDFSSTLPNCENLKLCGSVVQTHVQTSDYHLRYVMNTYYVTIDNCTKCPLIGTWLNIVLRSIACNAKQDLCLFEKTQCALPMRVKFLLPSTCNGEEELCVQNQCEITGAGYSVQIPVLPIGRTIVTIVVTIDVPAGMCAPPCTLLPAQVHLRIIKWHCSCPVVCFQTSTLIGCQPQTICCDDGEKKCNSHSDDCGNSHCEVVSSPIFSSEHESDSESIDALDSSDCSDETETKDLFSISLQSETEDD
jgi:hypothetical protein